MRAPRLRLLAPAIALLATACADSSPVAVAVGERSAEPGTVTFAYRCDADPRAGSVHCAAPVALPSGVAADLIVGSTYVKLTSSNPNYNSSTQLFTFDVTVQNKIGQPIGTTDGSTADPNGIRAFFHSGPTVTSGSGTISVLADGTGTFTATNQPYYQYTTVLDSGEVSAPKTWTLVMPPTVLTFSFTLYVSAPVQYQNGWITVTLDPESVSSGGSPAIATALVRSALGAVITSGTVSWSSASTSIATTSALDSRRAEVYGVNSGFTTINASYTSGGTTLNGSAWIGVF